MTLFVMTSAIRDPIGEPIATPSSCLQNLLSNWIMVF